VIATAGQLSSLLPASLSGLDLLVEATPESLGAEPLVHVWATRRDAVNALMTGGAPKPKLDGKQPLMKLIEELTKKKDCSHIYIRRDGVSLTLGKSSNPNLSI
jgi:hypothetical protein